MDRVELTGGVEANAYYISKHMSKKNKVVVVCSYQKGLKRHQKNGNLEVYRVGPEHQYTNEGAVLTRFMFARSAYKFAKNLEKGDVVVGSSFISYLPACRAAKKLKIPAIAIYHETWIGEWIKNKGLITGTLGNIWERMILMSKWDKIISVSEFTKKRLSCMVDEKKIVVIPNGIDLSSFKKIKVKKNKNPTLISIGRLTKKKRIADLINAIPIIKKEIPKIKLTIIGKGPELENLKCIANNGVTFKGFIKNRDSVIKYLKESHVLVAPSVLEGFGIVLLESMASSIPYVCSDIGPFIEVTKKGKGGLIFKKEDHIDLAEKVIKLLKNKKLYASKVKEAEKLVKEYDWSKISKQVEHVCEEVL
ncbi:glycosyltransferase family 4 protein [Nanoarchaeota archaeon]